MMDNTRRHKRRPHPALQFRLPVFLILCLLLGGTSQNIVSPKLPLYLLSILLITWVFIKTSLRDVMCTNRGFVAVFGLFFLISALQLISMPPSLWSSLPGRGVIVDGFEAAKLPLPWLPISMTPEQTFFSLFDFLPPAAMFLTAIHLAGKREIKNAVYALLGFTAFAAILGFIQTVTKDVALFPYDFTNFGKPVGLFSNANHQATLLLMSLPFAVALMDLPRWGGRYTIAIPGTRTAAGLVLTVLFLIALAFSQSVAGLGLAAPALGLSVLTLWVFRTSRPRWLYKLPFAAASIAIALSVFAITPLLQTFSHYMAAEKDMGRPELFTKAGTATAEYFPFGSGLGSFKQVFPLFEDHAIISRTFAPHVHNDYLEIFIEFGLGGMLLIAVFLVLFILRFRSVLTSRVRSAETAAMAGVASLMVLIHSAVDFPLRTIAISALLAFCIALMRYRDDEKPANNFG